MYQLIIDDAFFNIFPDAKIYTIIARGIDNSKRDEALFTEQLNAAKKSSLNYLPLENFSDNVVIQEWRDAFKQFKTKKGARSSIEALLKRAHQDRDFNPINPLVDLYNSISLTYAVPCGGEDLSKIEGTMHLGIAQGGEDFIPLGETESAPALENEVIYYDETGAICRCFNWREAQRTMLTENTTEAILVIEAINASQSERAESAMNALIENIESYFNVTCEYKVISKKQP
ncbi:B3/4 domain-containing protein [Macrococcus sp. EM39E]|uniref:B3/B4 domain-containing protein n=1 Tax=Macrococcus animalis TaxID=3395467 RepID=UPI0039BEC748